VLKLEDGAGGLKQRQVHPSTGLGTGGHAPIVSVGDIAMMEAEDPTPVGVALPAPAGVAREPVSEAADQFPRDGHVIGQAAP